MLEASSPSPFPEARVLLTQFLCVVLFTGCAGVRTDAGAGVFGPSWQARDAAYLQEEGEADDEFGERMEGAGRKAKRKEAWFWVFAIAMVLVLVADVVEGESEKVTFEDPLDVELSVPTSASVGLNVDN